MDLDEVWPLFRLRLRTPRLELRLIRDEDLGPLIEASVAGIHDPAFMPFSSPWSDAPPDEQRRSFAQYQWRTRAETTRDDWRLDLAVVLDGTPVGTQSMSAKRFGLLRTVGTGSWLTQSVQGRGIGTEMRAAVLLFAFDWLGAEYAESGARVGNHASFAISRRLGYRDNGLTRRESRPGELSEHLDFRLHRDQFVRPEWILEVEGFDAVRAELLDP